MEADWSIALAADDPVVTVPWSGGGREFVDLRQSPQKIDQIEEARKSAPLHLVLLLLNGSGSPFWTAKCDVWARSTEQGDAPLDPYEMKAKTGETGFGAGSYIDLLPRHAERLSTFDQNEKWLRAVTEKLRATPADCARTDLVLRPSEVHGVSGFALTWFVEGCGASATDAAKRWGEALIAALTVITDTMTTVGE
jgi:hypothetical protein